jgi:putative component of toxin-antitoxin plasmid stabilization module
VKQKIDITLKTLHLGECRRVVTLGINGKDEADAFLQKLRKDDSRKWDAINTRISTVSNHPTYSNKITFNPVGDGIFEFKRPGLRLYAFYDEIGEDHQLILCTNGGSKNKKKEQQTDIDRAKSLKAKYEAAKLDKNTRFNLKKLDHES